MSEDAHTSEGVRLSLPPVPLTDEKLRPLAESEEIVAVYVPDGRPKSVRTGGGAQSHEGDIMSFWIEREDRYRKVTYESGDGGGLAWYAAPEPAQKSTTSGTLVARVIQEDYRALAGEAGGKET